MPLLDDFASYMQTQGLGTVKTSGNNPATWPIYKVPEIPAQVEKVIFLAEYSGQPYIGEMGLIYPTNIVAELPRPQIQVRALDYSMARARAQLIWQLIWRTTNIILGTTRYLGVEPLASPMPIGRDENKRWIIACNYEIAKEMG